MSLLKTVGRGLLSAIFITSGANTVMHPEGIAQAVEASGIPQARQATILNGALMLLGGTALAVDVLPKLASLTLIGTMIPTTLLGHPFWKEDDPANRTGQRIHFMKNLAMIGGLILVLFERDEDQG
ncbi:putative membrane protein YphA (DoxX/SURF4 family) [Thermosporothrix hazakensis]|jgi:uncharacterized membrane protein YphA (DoxX/SURF4 family)|uniref:DoxX family protein n=2 Tax=Thermosporothrix TaxID=768650 RepID=A0A455SSR0_9CHLR|nr:DoxX family protein [Thermosporothrix hazakensis]PZW32074.1 putative membrane protein YphA (DoxX/SURF4 family) [Thermosporothrix hazakensis]BBH91453.1 hypothetical protein KTC_62040 [Thermosporothrix sp. COM3]GCE49598.1 hypothetical protein KTH_44670 [Thermosporothrix hazakensis]